ncbi:MAG: hypothetical protein H7Y02_13715 [Candidatus Obscuribacterales bacterium]|nr:hypothetical protein [Steroidobacteraceae bacterium]
MQTTSIENIREAVYAAREAAREELDVCDAADIEELVEVIELELEAEHPNIQILTTFLNSLSRSLRRDPKGQRVWLQLDAAMQRARIPLH